MSLDFVAVGDVGPDRDDPETIFDAVRDRIRAADLGFCQLEVNLTKRGARLPQARHTIRGKPEIGAALVQAGFEIISFAGNHCLDWGEEGLLDTIATLESAGAVQVGTGPTLDAARRPAIIERGGISVGVLAVNSILPMNYWADERRAGCAPLRAHTVYEQIEHDQPGTPARIVTYAQRGDLAALVEGVKSLRRQVDVVIVSHHAGIHFVPAVIPDYQREVAHAVIDAGADLVLGHHAHILKGIEIYKGKTIAYSLANFAIDLLMDEAHAKSRGFKEIQKLNPDWVPDFSSRYNFPPDSAMSVMVEARLSKEGIRDVHLVPIMIGKDAMPRIVDPGDPDFERIRRYLADISDHERLGSAIERDGDRLIVRHRQ
ncbi:CapA family protein [Pelagibacterium flavum]|uniref:CapA family protein n=1 Tax=Pelagibacterium flavum TaxID=2984530 RepID=A0ABY6IRK3_9HYPH|nr:CapA family protein [Pelagibacterium sp. YIM 151497]UYQ72069.1 CapA family protein [Pelagibacterium sp. YIM 151497]